MSDAGSTSGEKSREMVEKSSWKEFLKSPTFRICLTYGFSTWAERSWTFTLSLALYQVGQNLQLPAISDMANCLGVLFFGALIGRWIDASQRLKAGQFSLFANNLMVVLSALTFMAVFNWQTSIPTWGIQVLTAVSIVLCAVGDLAQTGTKIILTRDWIVVICKGDKNRLAKMNSWLVTIDLTASILSPLVVSQIIAYVSILYGCLFNAAWNLCSFALEYYLLWLVYESEPQLAIKNSKQGKSDSEKNSDSVSQKSSVSEQDEKTPLLSSSSDFGDLVEDDDEVKSEKSKSGCLSFVSGWKLYYEQEVFAAGVAFALLYFTVLGLSGITNSFIVSQGIQSNVLAAMRGVGAITGISGTVVFPMLRKRIGLTRTGLFALTFEISCLALSVASIWLPGSPFDPIGYFSSTGTPVRSVDLNNNANRLSYIPEIGTGMDDVERLLSDTSSGYGNFSSSPINSTQSTSSQSASHSVISIWIFVIGVILARFGLWMADLTILQTMQEHVDEGERGAVFGVQNALNKLMGLLKDLIVILLPDPETFGIPIIISFVAVSTGFLFYCYYSRKIRGHLLPFHSCCDQRKESTISAF